MSIPPDSSSDLNLEQLVHNICRSRKITRHDQHLIMQFGQQYPQAEIMNQLYNGIRCGLIRVVD